MNIVLIHGQNHKGSSYHIGRMLVEKLGNETVAAEFFLPKDLNHFCIGCYKCLEDETACPAYAQKANIKAAILAADLLIFTTPTYCLRASAPMKAFIDLTFTWWLPHTPAKEMFSKKAVVISTAAGTGTKPAMKDISTALLFWGVPYIRKYGVSVQAMGWADVSDAKKERIRRDVARLAKAVSTQKARVGIKTKLLFGVTRAMHSGYDDANREKIYWAQNGWLGQGRPWK